jgi:hypothetical protein
MYSEEKTPLQPVQPDPECLCRQLMMVEAFRPRPATRRKREELAEDLLASA